jgi:DNA-binding transcriptional LysR family regulator
MIPNFSLRQLGYLVAVAEAGSMTAAAEAEHVSQAAISMGIHDLERRLGVQLLARRPGHGVTLTEAGAQVVLDARRVLAATADLQSAARTPSAELRGTLNIGCFTTLAPIYLPALLGDFAVMHPALDLQITEGTQPEIQQALSNGTCEVALMYEPTVDDGTLAMKTIITMSPYALLPADHRLAGRASLALEDLLDEPLVQYAHEAAPPGAVQEMRNRGWAPREVHTSSNIELVRSLVARGLGWTPLFQRWPADRSMEGLPLASVPISDGVPSIRVVAAWPAQDHLSKRAEAVVAFLARIARGVAAERTPALKGGDAFGDEMRQD